MHTLQLLNSREWIWGIAMKSTKVGHQLYSTEVGDPKVGCTDEASRYPLLSLHAV